MRYPEPDGSADDITHSSAHRRTDGIANGCSEYEPDSIPHGGTDRRTDDSTNYCAYCATNFYAINTSDGRWPYRRADVCTERADWSS